MACVTLKRSLDFDPLYSPNRPNKRRRCIPMHCTPEKKTREEESHKPSSFLESHLSPEQIANNLRDEIKRMKRRRQIIGWSRDPPSPGSAPSSPEPMMESELPGSSSSSSLGPDSSLVAPAGKEKPIFTLKQMTLIAERMCKERVDKVRQEYDEILQQKLSEQYESFVKFIDQQIQRRFTESHAPSYLS